MQRRTLLKLAAALSAIGIARAPATAKSGPSSSIRNTEDGAHHNE